MSIDSIWIGSGAVYTFEPVTQQSCGYGVYRKELDSQRSWIIAKIPSIKLIGFDRLVFWKSSLVWRPLPKQ